ncbi:MAG: NAD-dependent epimerase/dehydratase family protein [Deltaproteobacteria bacterium]|nr:NAD-dependent epimerase/dehydratase family protein [Deltaproteobacteria bacterium]
MSGVLVTGADAPIGERLVRTLLDDKRVSHVLAVGARPLEQALPFTNDRRLTYLSVDLRRERRVREMLFGPARDLGVRTVLHTAMGRGAGEEGKGVHLWNVEATRDLLALCERHPTVKTFVLRSYAEVYQVQADLPVLIGEDHPLNLSPNAPQYVRDRVEADLHACVRMGLSPLRIVVLRCAEVLAPGTGSQLFDYLESPICFRPMGYDPMLNLMSVNDLVEALGLAAHAGEQGVFNVPGADTLPLSLCIQKWGRPAIPVPGAWMTPLYRWRRQLRGHDFSYGMNRRRFHYSGVLDGRRARDVLGYVPSHPIDWPVSG